VTVVATIEARMTSSRLPGKMMLPIGGKPALGLLIDRLWQVSELDHVVLATTVNTTDDVLEEVALTHGAKVFRGSEQDVLGRVCGALESVDAEVCIEITGDCPLTDPEIVSSMITEFFATRDRHPYVANTTGPQLGVPHGLDVQVFEAAALRKIEMENSDADAREHVSMPFYRNGERSVWNPRFVSYFPSDLCRKVWLSLDYREDYVLLRDIHESLATVKPDYRAADLIEACLARPDLNAACLDLRAE
jgi:spore coat polysaccharide biosynthesis protein SpsF